MPFQSKKQRAYLAINNPKVAKKLAKHKVAKKRGVTKNKLRRGRATIGVKG